MEIKVGYELIYDCPRPTPMMLVLNIHYSRASDIVVPDHVTTVPSIHLSAYRDFFGNWCTRLVAPAGRLRIASAASVKDSGEPDIVAPAAQQHSIEELPEEALAPRNFPRWLGACLVKPRRVGAGSRQSVISCTTIFHLAMSMPARPEPPGKRSTRGKASAAISPILLWHCAAA